eukprot:GGOE01005523.1.p1 GENE.GGOE01005523.1~~GGOE01005523.1.p1  ORF type:complete len:449 (-),score=32.27 GGOE01005523.1:745-2091(-)
MNAVMHAAMRGMVVHDKKTSTPFSRVPYVPAECDPEDFAPRSPFHPRCERCSRPFTEVAIPRLLSCGHTCCQVCLSIDVRENYVRCFKCPCVTFLPSGSGIEGLRRNFALDVDLLGALGDMGSASPTLSEVAEALGAQCTICCYTYSAHRVPRLLQCGHTYCQVCLNRMLELDAIECPIDHVKTPLTPQQDAQSLDANDAMESLIKSLRTVFEEAPGFVDREAIQANQSARAWSAAPRAPSDSPPPPAAVFSHPPSPAPATTEASLASHPSTVSNASFQRQGSETLSSARRVSQSHLMVPRPYSTETAPGRNTPAVMAAPTLPPRIQQVTPRIHSFPSRTRDPRVPGHTYSPQPPLTATAAPPGLWLAHPTPEGRQPPPGGRTTPTSRPMTPLSCTVPQRMPHTSRLASNSFPSASPRPNRTLGAPQAPLYGMSPAQDSSFLGSTKTQ